MPKSPSSLLRLLLCLGLSALAEGAFLESRAFPLFLLPALLAIGAAGFLLSRSSPDRSREKGLSLPWEALLLALILIFALALRLYHLDSLPEGTFRDEGQSGIVAAKMMLGQNIYDTGTSTPLFLILVPSGFFYPMALIFKLWGVSLYGVRLDSVFFSILSIAAFYFLARRFLGQNLALLLTAMLALLRWHLNFSRIGLLGIMTFFIQIPLAYGLALAFQARGDAKEKKSSWLFLGLALFFALLRVGFSSLTSAALGDSSIWYGLILEIPGILCLFQAFKTRRARLFILTAAVMGFSFYTYAAAYLLVVLVLGWVLYAVMASSGGLSARSKNLALAALASFGLGLGIAAEGNALGIGASLALGWLFMGLGLLMAAWLLFSERERFSTWMRPLALAALSFLIVSGPMLDYYFSHLARVNSRPNRISIFQHEIPNRDPSWGHALELNFAKTLGMFNVRGDSNSRHNLPNQAMLNPVWAGLFALGVSLCLWEALSPLSFFLLLWWQATLLGGYFSIEAPQAYRSMDVIAPALLILGYASSRLWSWMRRFVDPSLLGPLLAVLLVCGPGLYELYVFFGPQANLAERWSAFSSDESEMGQDYRACPEDTVALLRPDWVDSYAFKFAAYPYEQAFAFDASTDIPLKRSGLYGKDLLYVLDSDSLPLKSILEKNYPGGRYGERHHPVSGEFLYWSYFVPAAENLSPSATAGGLEASYYADLGEDWRNAWRAQHWKAENFRMKRLDPFVLFHWTVAPIVERFYSAKWEGSLKAPKNGNYGFFTNSDDYTRLEIDGRKVLESPSQPFAGGWVEGHIPLLSGHHHIVLYYYSSKNTAHVEFWWQPPKAEEKSLVPTEALSPPPARSERANGSGRN